MAKDNLLGHQKPIIGILTQPVRADRKVEFKYHDYVWEVNENFIRWGGSRTVSIPFDSTDQELYDILG